MITVKEKSEIALMRRAGGIVATLLDALDKAVQPGVTTQELDDLVAEGLKEAGAGASFLGYHGFPAHICTSVNDEVVHGIPSRKVRLKAGDILGVDLGVMVDGYHADGARTYPVGKVSSEAGLLLKATRESRDAGVRQAVAGKRVSHISRAVERHVRKHGFSVVRDLVGHGIGKEMHEAPQVPNFTSEDKGPVLKPGMTLAIEPMVNAGDYRVRVAEDGWTVRTWDGSLSAHFEHTVLVTDGEPVVLTAPPGKGKLK